MSMIKRASKEDLMSIARCHQKAFPRALSSAMGTRYLRKMLDWYLQDERAFLFFIEEEGHCAGYCGGLKVSGTSQVGSASSMIQHSFNQALITFVSRPWLLLHPEFIRKYRLAARNVLKRVQKVFRKSLDSPRVESKLLPAPHAGLIVIGVDPMFEGMGYGSKLLNEFETISQGFGFSRLSLTVKTENLKAIKVYARNGWITTEVKGSSTTMEKTLI